MVSPRAPLVRTLGADGKIWTEQRGTGPDIVLIAGLGDSHEVWADVVGPLVERFRVTTLDNRGVGHSPVGAGQVSIRSFAEDVLTVMSAWKIEHAHVVGSSMGGAIAQELACARPEVVQSLSLVGNLVSAGSAFESAPPGT